jgi:LysM repeat protein
MAAMAAIWYRDICTDEPGERRPELVLIEGGGQPAALPARTRRHPAAVYARRRLVVLAMAALLVAAIAFALTARGGTPAVGEGEPISATVHVVQPGETMWSIASELDPNGDPRALVDRLAELNGGSAVQIGQRLVLP